MHSSDLTIQLLIVKWPLVTRLLGEGQVAELPNRVYGQAEK
jgi:hypothetical protein